MVVQKAAMNNFIYASPAEGYIKGIKKFTNHWSIRKVVLVVATVLFQAERVRNICNYWIRGMKEETCSQKLQQVL